MGEATDKRRKVDRGASLAGRGLLGGALSFVQVMRELDLGEIQRQFETPVRILVTATEQAEATRVAEQLFGPSGLAGWSVAVGPLLETALSQDVPDLVLLVVQPEEDALALVRQCRHAPGWAEIPLVALALGDQPPAGASEEVPRFGLVAVASSERDELAERVPAALLELAPSLGLALGRRFPVFRRELSERLIRETSRANAQFALLSSLPANLPIVGGLASSAADLAVLTKNQAVLVYKLAGIHGRDLDDRVSLALEIAPVIGGAFFWRSLARTLLGLLPTVLGGLPKAGVAYAGTFAVGQMARYYYLTGRRPPPELVTRFKVEGSRLAREVALRLERWQTGG